MVSISWYRMSTPATCRAARAAFKLVEHICGGSESKAQFGGEEQPPRRCGACLVILETFRVVTAPVSARLAWQGS